MLPLDHAISHYVCVCRVIYMEPLTFKEQIKVYASSQVLLMTHGAALVNILFMPEVNTLPCTVLCISTAATARVNLLTTT